MRVYLVTFNQAEITDLSLLQFFDTRPEILNWYNPYPGSVFIVSNFEANFITQFINQKFPFAQFIVTLITIPSIDGRLTSVGWEFIGQPKSSGKWPLGALNPFGLGSPNGLGSNNSDK